MFPSLGGYWNLIAFEQAGTPVPPGFSPRLALAPRAGLLPGRRLRVGPALGGAAVAGVQDELGAVGEVVAGVGEAGP